MNIPAVKQMRQLRKLLGMTQEEFAERMGLNRWQVANRETGRSTWTADEYIAAQSLHAEATRTYEEMTACLSQCPRPIASRRTA